MFVFITSFNKQIKTNIWSRVSPNQTKTFFCARKPKVLAHSVAMAFYGIGPKPILTRLRKEVPEVKQVWLADDATGAGKLTQLKTWWVKVAKEGAKFGYFVKPSKSWLVLKDRTKLEETKELFKDSPINITTDGKRHLGASIGTDTFKDDYMREKVEKWCKKINILSEIAKSQPHAAFSAYTFTVSSTSSHISSARLPISHHAYNRSTMQSTTTSSPLCSVEK